MPSFYQDRLGANVGKGPQSFCRYAYADWPVCSVRNAKSSGGSTTMPLPARIFQLSICGGDRCPGIMCRTSHCPSERNLPQKADDELAATMAAVGSVLAARAEVVAAPSTSPPPRENFIPASSPSCWYTGRTQINADGSRSFDWEVRKRYFLGTFYSKTDHFTKTGSGHT